MYGSTANMPMLPDQPVDYLFPTHPALDEYADMPFDSFRSKFFFPT